MTKLQDSRAIPALKTALNKDYDPFLKLTLARALVEMKDRAGYAGLIAILKNDEAGFARNQAIELIKSSAGSDFGYDADKDVAGNKEALLRLEKWETRVVSCPFAAEFRQHRDATRFAHEYVPTLRSWTESTFFAALSSKRPLEERRAIIDRYYNTYETAVRENPEGHGMDFVHIYLTIAKTEA